MTAFFVFATLLLQVFVPYHRYVFFLKWLTLSLLAYAAVLFTVHVPWGQVALRTVWPRFTAECRRRRRRRRRLRHHDQSLPLLLAGLGGGRGHAGPSRDSAARKRRAARPAPELRRIRGTPGAACSIPTSPPTSSSWPLRVTLHVAGITDIDTAAQAASALRPLAGEFAYMLFALGILGVGLIGVPVLAGSGAYALAEAMGWKEGLERKAHRRARLLRRHRGQRARRLWSSSTRRSAR